MTEKTKLDYITRKKTQEDYLKRLREFFKKFNEDRKEKKRLPTLPPSFLRKNIPLPSQLKKQMDEYKKMMRQNKSTVGTIAIKNKDGTITHRKKTPEESKATIKRAKELSIKLNPSDFDLKTGRRLTDEDKMKRQITARDRAVGKTYAKGGGVRKVRY